MALYFHFFRNFLGYADLGFYWMKLHKKFTYKIHIIINNNDAIWMHKAQQGSLLFCFSGNSCYSSISDFIAWNRTKICMQYTCFERWNWYIFCEQSLLADAVVMIFSELSEKCRACFLLNKTIWYFFCKIDTLIEITLIYFRCLYLYNGRYHSVFF